MLLGTQESLIIIARYQLRCPELRYRLMPIEEHRGRENASAVLYLTDVRIEVLRASWIDIDPPWPKVYQSVLSNPHWLSSTIFQVSLFLIQMSNFPLLLGFSWYHPAKPQAWVFWSKLVAFYMLITDSFQLVHIPILHHKEFCKLPCIQVQKGVEVWVSQDLWLGAGEDIEAKLHRLLSFKYRHMKIFNFLKQVSYS